MNKKVTISVFTSFLILFAGCSTNVIDYKASDYNASKELGQHKDNALLPKITKEEENVDKYVDLSSIKTIKSVLSDLGWVENRIYMLSPESKNIEVLQCQNSKLMQINSLEKLKNYIEDTTRYTLKVSKNKFYKNAPKIVVVIDKEEDAKSLSKITLNEIVGKVSVEDVFAKIAQKSGFSIVYKNMTKEQSNSSMLMSNEANSMGGGMVTPMQGSFGQDDLKEKDIKFTKEKIYFSENNAEEFLNFVRDYFDVYVETNYNTKIITISRYETKVFSNLLYHGMDFAKFDDDDDEIESSLDSARAGGSGGSSSSSSSSSYGNSENNANSAGGKNDINNPILTIAPKANFYFDDKSGNLVVIATYRDMKGIEAYLLKLDETYNKRIDIEVSVYELAISKSYDYGVDVSISGTTNIMGETLALDAGTKYVKNNFLSLSNNAIKDKATTSFGAQSDADFIKLLNFTTYSQKATNNILNSMNITTARNYLKNVTVTTTTTTTTPISNTTTEVGVIQEGSIIRIMPRVVGNKIFIKSEIQLTKVTQMEEKTIGEETITMPTIAKKKIPANIMLFSGEKKIIASYTSYDRADKYKGILPMDKFAIGGVNGEEFIKKELVFVMQAKEIN